MSSSAPGTPLVAHHTQAVGVALQSRKEEELNRKDRTLAEFLPMMENYNPIVSLMTGCDLLSIIVEGKVLKLRSVTN